MHLSRSALVLVTGLLAGSGLALGGTSRPASSASDTATGTVDRTLLCSTTVGARTDLYVRMTSPKPTASPPQPGSGSFSSGSNFLASQALVGFSAGSTSGYSTGQVFIGRTRCATSMKTVPLTSQGLPGPAVPFDQTRKCQAPARVLVRIRAVLDRGVTWRLARGLFFTPGKVSSAYLAARTEAGRPIAFMKLVSGRMGLWTAASCE